MGNSLVKVKSHDRLDTLRQNPARVRVHCIRNNRDEIVIVPQGIRLNSSMFDIFQFVNVTKDSRSVTNYVL